MIDITKAKKAFKEYIQNYDINNPKVKLKIAHIERTADIAKKTAESLNLEKEDIELAELIGLLHDIGRFEQIKRYNTFVDHLSENHAELGVNILFKENLIRKFIEDDKYDKIIELAIINHNKDKNDITKNTTEKEDLHIKLIRDSDKTDIIYLLTFEDKKAAWEKEDLSEEVFTEEIYREFIEDKNIFYPNMKTCADRLIGHFAFVYDFNYEYGLKTIYENKYYTNIYSRFNFNSKRTEEQFENIYKTTMNYINERLNKNDVRYSKSRERIYSI